MRDFPKKFGLRVQKKGSSKRFTGCHRGGCQHMGEANWTGPVRVPMADQATSMLYLKHGMMVYV